ncbi:MAG: retropepsin-like aspartic protease [Thermoanaerobaculia bacterium]
MRTKSRFALAALAAALVMAPAAGAQVIRRQGPPPEPYRSFELPSGSTEVPMMGEGSVVLEVRINGQGPYRFALDTGAGGAGRISLELARKLGLKPAGEVITGDPSGKNTRSLQLVEMDTLTLGGAAFKGVRLMARDLPQPPGGQEAELDGVLGIGLFKNHLLTLDYPARKVRIEAGELPPVDGREIVAFRMPNGVPAIKMKIGGLELDTDVDSGNMRGEVTLPASYIGKVPLEKEPVVVGHGRTGFNEFEIKQAPLKGAVQIGSRIVENPRVDFVEIFPVANVGHAFLRRFVVTIDQKNLRMRFR